MPFPHKKTAPHIGTRLSRGTTQIGAMRPLTGALRPRALYRAHPRTPTPFGAALGTDARTARTRRARTLPGSLQALLAMRGFPHRGI